MFSPDQINSLLQFAAFYQCLIFALVFFFQKDGKHSAGKLLSLYMLVVTLFFFLNIVSFNGFLTISYYTENLYYAVVLSITPLFFLYVKCLLGEFKWSYRLGWYFLPSVLFFLIYGSVYWFGLPYDDKITYVIYPARPEIPLSDGLAVLYQVTGIAFTTVYTGQYIVYFIMMVRLILRHRRNIQNNFSYTENLNLNWLILTSGFFIFLSLMAIILATAGLEQKKVMIAFNAMMILINLVIGLFGLNQHDIYKTNLLEEAAIAFPPGGQTTEKEPDRNHSRENYHSDLIRRMEDYFEHEKPYLKHDLSVEDVALALNTNKLYVSRIINSESGMNFYHFVNRYRVQRARELLCDPGQSRLTISALAQSAGFKSISTFNLAFKKFEGCTPSEFRERK